jgi:hypothetical protein
MENHRASSGNLEGEKGFRSEEGKKILSKLSTALTFDCWCRSKLLKPGLGLGL